MTAKKKPKKKPALNKLDELKAKTAAFMGEDGAGSQQADKALGRGSKNSRKTKSLYITEEDERQLQRMAAALLMDGIKASESILIRAALSTADASSKTFRAEVAAMLEERGESLKAGYARRGRRKAT